MAESNITSNNEFETLPPDQVVLIASCMLDEHSEDTNRALALAIALRDRIESKEGDMRDPTSTILARMLVEEMSGAPEYRIKQCLSALLKKCQIAEVEHG